MKSITDQIISRIKRRKPGWVFTPKDFLDVGSRAAIDQVLSRLVKQGMVQRVDRGIYYYPKHSKLLGALSPWPEKIAIAMAAGDIIYPSGAVAANLLRLSTQVPAKSIYISNFTVRSRRVGGQTIVIKKARIPLLHNVNHKTNFMVQALSYLGKRNIDDIIIQRCACIITEKDISHINRALSHLPGWLVDTFHEIQQARQDKYDNKAKATS